MVYSDATKKATYKYRTNKTKPITIYFKNEVHDQIKLHADNAGVPLATYIRDAVNTRMDQEDRVPRGGKQTVTNKAKE